MLGYVCILLCTLSSVPHPRTHARTYHKKAKQTLAIANYSNNKSRTIPCAVFSPKLSTTCAAASRTRSWVGSRWSESFDFGASNG